MIRYPFICMYFGTRCASFAGSLEQPTTAIVRMSLRIFLICFSSTISSADGTHAPRLRFLWEDAPNGVLEARREIQLFRFFGGEPTDLGVLLVRDFRIPTPAGDEEQVVTEEILGRRIDVLIDPEEPGPERRDAQLFLKLADQSGRGFLAGDQMSAEGVPHARESNRARPLPQEDAPVVGDQARGRHMKHIATKALLGYPFFSEKRGDLVRGSLPKIHAFASRWVARWRPSLRRSRSACAPRPSSGS